MVNLVKEVRALIRKGVYEPDDLFKIVYNRHPVHYSRVREAIHAAKTS